MYGFVFFFFKQKTAYEMRISDWSSDVCSSDLLLLTGRPGIADGLGRHRRRVLPARSRRRRRAGPAHRPGAATGVAHGPAMDRPWTGRSRRPYGGGHDA